MQLDEFDNGGFDRGASRLKETLWLAISNLAVSTWLPGSRWRVILLRAFGARIGEGAVIKPGVRVKFPWRLTLGRNVWIGERVWVDNLAGVTVGDDCCISQGAYLCTGSHDWGDPRFALVTRPILLEGECWVGARAILAPGTVMERGAILTLGAVGRGRLTEWRVHSGGSNASKPREESGTIRQMSEASQ